jgi:hypothetical protein
MGRHGVCVDCLHRFLCRMVQEESYEIGGKETITGVVSCEHYDKENSDEVKV